MKVICPYCEKKTNVQFVETIEDFEIRGESIPVKVEYFTCAECGGDFDDPKSDKDPIEKAYREYRFRKGMMQPEDIRELRNQYGLTQKELSDLLGWGGVTLNRYENGSLQTEANDKMLRLLKKPGNLFSLIESRPDAIPEEKRQTLINRLNKIDDEACSLQSLYEKIFSKYPVDEYSGYQKMDLDKFKNAVLYFCFPNGAWKSKLNKEMFYADFKHNKEYGVPITGSNYVRIPYGPSPDKYAYHYATLTELDVISIEEEIIGNYIGEILKSKVKPDLTLFSDSELLVLASVKEFFKNFTAKEIEDFSHEERGYDETEHARPISYKYSEYLKV